jgi:MFS transporter, DHA3 family, macrolide efflux protein
MQVLMRLTGLPAPALWFLAGTLASNVGNGIHTLAAGALLYQQTGTVAAFGAVVVVEQAVTFLMQAIAGPSVDRGDPKRAAILAEIVRGLGVCGSSLLLFIGTTGALSLIMAMTVIIRVAHTFHRAGTFALSPDLVATTDLTRLNSWFSACQQGGQLVGLAATALIVAHAGPPAAFLVNGVSFLISAATLGAIPSSRAPAAHRALERSGPIWRTMLEGWLDFGRSMLRDVRLVALIVVSTADNVALILFNLILAPFVAERFAGNPGWLSLIAGAFAFGAMSASAATVLLANRLGARRSVLLGLAGQTMCFAALWWTELPTPLLLIAIMLGAFNTISWTTAVSTVQRDTPPLLRGRVAMARNALTGAIVAPLVPLSAAVSASFSQSTPLLLASGACAAFLLTAAATIRRPELRGKDSATPTSIA